MNGTEDVFFPMSAVVFIIIFPNSSVCVHHLHFTDALWPTGKYINNSRGLAATLHEKLHLPLPEQLGCQ